MKRMTKRLGIVILAVCMMAAMLMMPVTTNATTANGAATTKRYNIMLVIDGSGSLISDSKTDPYGMRYELIDDLLGVLEDDGHYVGAVVFSGNRGSGTSDAEMESGILCNTGMVSLDPDVMTPDGSLPKDYIAQKIRKAYVDLHFDGKTDVGTALLVAERELRKAQEQNGLDSLIFLFTDGITDITNPAVREISDKNMETATREIRENGIRLFGAFLNKDGKLTTNQITNIVCASNGISNNSEEFLESYVELRDAASCHEAVNTLLKFLGYLDGPMPEPTNEDILDEFFIPGVGVEEMNIRLYSYNGEDLPDLKVELTKPDGTVLSGTTLNAMCRSSRTIQVYKLINPMSGKWKLKVTVPKGNKIAYVYSRVFSKHVEADLTISPNVDDLHVNANAEFTATLSQNGVTVTDPLAYTCYSCQLEIQNEADGTVTTYPITGNGSQFAHKMVLTEYGRFKARVVFSCDSFVVESEYVTYDLFNHEPETNSPVPLNLKCGLFQDKETEVDLVDYINDLEDDKNLLTITPVSATCDSSAYSYSDGELLLYNDLVGDSQLVFHVMDTQGATAELLFEVRTTNMTLRYAIYLVLVLLMIGAVVTVKIYADNSKKPDGDLTATFEVKIDNKRKDITLLLDVPGRDAAAKTSLGALIQTRLEDDSERHDGVTSAKIKEQLTDVEDALKAIKISKTVVRIHGKKLGGLIVKSGKNTYHLPDASGRGDAELAAGDLDISLSYTREEMDDPLSADDWDLNETKKSLWTRIREFFTKKNRNEDFFDDSL